MHSAYRPHTSIWLLLPSYKISIDVMNNNELAYNVLMGNTVVHTSDYTRATSVVPSTSTSKRTC